jgi:hypothetical protein
VGVELGKSSRLALGLIMGEIKRFMEEISTRVGKNKFCSECKWAKRSFVDWFFGSGWKFAKCHRKELFDEGESFVDQEVGGTFCSINRDPRFKRCGPEGKYWEKK